MLPNYSNHKLDDSTIFAIFQLGRTADPSGLTDSHGGYN